MEQKCPKCGAPLPSGVLAGLCPACLMKQGAAADTSPGAGASPENMPFQPPSVEEVAKLFPQLQVIALIGKGGMGAVYKARQPALDRLVALKILPPQAINGPGFVERFNREARALARLNHPNIVAVYEFGQVNGLPFFVMEFVDGVNLRELERAGKLSPQQALQIVPQICEALQFAHDEGIVHRDIKPENILLDKKGRVKIADFGIAKILGTGTEADLTKTQGVIGTPNYMAPEQMEKPTSVDHRADIFSLGVVFYEMLTGELPLGKFAPPSSRKVEVDVRLDDVVLRTLERDPERRYQHASQVKTAVDTIAGTTAPPPTSNASAIAHEILSKDYTLNIRSCIRRGWKLLRGEFWPFVGITALFIALFGFASSFGGNTIKHQSDNQGVLEMGSTVAALVAGPLWGGLMFYFLKKIRREPATVETAFCGFSKRFLHLFLAGFVTSLLTWLGFLCLVLPGIYLFVAWSFALPIVMDKQVDFWSAMELSRKVVTKHWFKLFGFSIVLFLLMFAGVLALFVGVFIMMPLVIASFMYAYEDVFGAATGAVPAPAATGPTGTIVMPPPAPQPARAGGQLWTPATQIGLAAVALVLVLFLFVSLLQQHHYNRRDLLTVPPDAMPQPVPPEVIAEPAVPMSPVAPAVHVTPLPSVHNEVFGPVIEQELQARATGTNQFLNLGAEQLLTPPKEISDVLAGSANERAWQGAWEALDIPMDSRRFQYIQWLRESGADLMFAGDGKIIGFDGIFAMAHGNTSMSWDNWDDLTPRQARAAVDVVDWTRRATEAISHRQRTPPAPRPGGVYTSAAQLDSREAGGPTVNLLTLDQSVNWFFKTREGRIGVLQLVGFTNDPPVAKIRYKLVQPAGSDDAVANDSSNKELHDVLIERLDAASNISIVADQDRALAAISLDAARASEVEIVKDALGKMNDLMARDAATEEAARLLAERGFRKQAIEMAKNMSVVTIRDRTLTELAQ